MLIDIVILPPAKVREAIGRKIKKEAAGYPALFVVDNMKLKPHLSLWHVRMRKGDIPELAKKLKDLVRNQKPIAVSSAGFTASKKSNTISFGVKRMKPMELLQRRAFEVAYPLRTGMMPQAKLFGPWKGEALKEAKKYGRPFWFDPHFTMGVMRRHNDALKVERKMRGIEFKFVANGVYICEVNRWWQVIRVIKKIHFGKK